MKELYKQKASDYISSIDLRVDQLKQMIEGTKQANNADARMYVLQIQKGLSELQELINIS